MGRTRKSLLALLAGAALVLAPLGCGMDKTDRPLTILIPVGANTLDPQFATSTIEWSILMNIFEPLIQRADDMSLVPALAERWEADSTKKVWTFHLRKGVKFQNGEPFDAESVRYTFERMRDRKVKARTTIPRRIALDHVEVVDEHTVRIHTRRPVATLPVWMVNAFMLPPKYCARASLKELHRKPVGTGPYKLVQWMKDDHLRMEANPRWWGGQPPVKEVLWRPVPEASARIAELETGWVDIITNISPDQGQILRKERSVRIVNVHGGRRIYIGIRTDHPPLGDVRVRRAMNYAVNFKAISKNILRGNGTRMASVVNPPNQNPAVKAYTFDPGKAKALLAEAGLKDTDGDGVLEWKGEPVHLGLDVPESRYLKGKEMAEAVASQLRRVGIDVEVHALEWSVFLGKRRKKTLAPLYFHGFSSAFNEELDVGVLRPELFANLTAWRNPAFVSGYRRLGRTFDADERHRISARLQQIVHDDAPWIFLWDQYDFYGVNDLLRWKPRPDERIYLPAVSLRKPKD